MINDNMKTKLAFIFTKMRLQELMVWRYVSGSPKVAVNVKVIETLAVDGVLSQHGQQVINTEFWILIDLNILMDWHWAY